MSSDYAAELMERDQRGGERRAGEEERRGRERRGEGRRGRRKESKGTNQTKLLIYSADSVFFNWCLAIAFNQD